MRKDNQNFPTLINEQGWAYTLWRFSYSTPLTPTAPFWLIPINRIAGEPYVQQGIGKSKVNLQVYQKIRIEGNMDLIPTLDCLFILPRKQEEASRE